VTLDTHGSERDIINGAHETLRDTALFVNEFYNFQSEERRWPQMVALVESLGFRCVDVIEPIWRADAVGIVLSHRDPCLPVDRLELAHVR
jgi:hypothetical protein